MSVASLAAAKARGKLGDQPRRMIDGKLEAARRLLASGVQPREVARDLGVSIATLYRWLPASEHARA